jgi:hypothetical protein
MLLPIAAKTILFLSCAGVIALGTLVYSQNRKGYLNRLFFICALLVSYRTFCEIGMRFSGTIEEACFWANTGFLRPLGCDLIGLDKIIPVKDVFIPPDRPFFLDIDLDGFCCSKRVHCLPEDYQGVEGYEARIENVKKMFSENCQGQV